MVDHAGGPLLVLAGPGTGKTTTIVATVADRIENRGISPERILVLTFSRKAAAELRERITARLRRTTREPLAVTFHSYAYALARREFVLAGDEPPRLLSAPEQLLEVRRLLKGEGQDGGSRWPERLRPALGTRGFAEEVRDLLLRAAERGLDGRGLRQLGKLRDRDDWMAAAAFLDRYAARFDLAPVPAYDYAEIVRIAAALLGRTQTRQRERDAYDVVLVDEYQDSDPAQESLLMALAGDGRELIAVGDPDQSIYAFRGADVRALTEFPDRFRTADGQPAPVVALRTCRRSGEVLLAASRRVARRLPAAPGASAAQARHRLLVPVPDSPPGEISILIADSSTQEAALVADTLRRAHLADGVPWSDMAVLVRSAARQVPLLRRALTAASVPVAVAGDELPMTDEPGTRPLLMLLRCALQPRPSSTSRSPPSSSAGRSAAPTRSACACCAAPCSSSPTPTRKPRARPTARTSPDMLAHALLDPRDLAVVPDRVAEPAKKVAALLATARKAIDRGGSAEDVLWAIWAAIGPRRAVAAGQRGGRPGRRGRRPGPGRGAGPVRQGRALRRQHAAGRARPVRRQPVRAGDRGRHAGRAGGPGGLRPDPDRAPVQGPGVGRRGGGGRPGGGLARPAAARLAARRGRAGRDGQARHASGPGPGRRRGRRHAGGQAAGRGTPAVLRGRHPGQEAARRHRRRRRGHRHPAVPLPDRAGRRGHSVVERVAQAQGGHRWLSMPALVADLRRAAADTARPLPVRQAAAAQLARLAEAGVRAAHPRDWYALTELSDDGPIVTGGEAVRLSPSQVESFTRCGLRWLLEAAVGAGSSDVLRHLGTVIHAAAVLTADGATERAVAERIDEIWHHLDFGSAWYSAKQRALAERMVRRFLDWHAANPRELVAVEQALKVRIGQVEITGRVDRLESDDEGRAVVVDLKTGGSAPREDELGRHPQLGVYQLAVLLGAFERFGLAEPGGAELVQVGKAAGVTLRAKVQRQGALAEDDEPGWAKDLVETVASGMAGPVFTAQVNPSCRTCPVASCCPVHPEGEQVTP